VVAWSVVRRPVDSGWSTDAVATETLHRPLPQTIDDIEQWYSPGKQQQQQQPAQQQEMTPINKDELNNEL